MVWLLPGALVVLPLPYTLLIVSGVYPTHGSGPADMRRWRRADIVNRGPLASTCDDDPPAYREPYIESALTSLARLRIPSMRRLELRDLVLFSAPAHAPVVVFDPVHVGTWGLFGLNTVRTLVVGAAPTSPGGPRCFRTLLRYGADAVAAQLSSLKKPAPISRRNRTRPLQCVVRASASVSP